MCNLQWLCLQTLRVMRLDFILLPRMSENRLVSPQNDLQEAHCLDPRPSPAHKLGILFPVNSKDLQPVWIYCKPVDGGPEADTDSRWQTRAPYSIPNISTADPELPPDAGSSPETSFADSRSFIGTAFSSMVPRLMLVFDTPRKAE